MSVHSKPLVALTVGDPAGIGPEIVTAALAHTPVREQLDLCVIGPAALRPADVPAVDEPTRSGRSLEWIPIEGPERWTLGEASVTGGTYALRALERGAQLAQAGDVDALVTAPVCKEALHLAGEKVEGQTELLGRWDGRPCWMIATAGDLRVLLVTRHMPLRLALDALTPTAVTEGAQALHDTLVRMGIAAPRIALAGINPHAGEGGLLGDDEERILEPALRTLRQAGINVAGPLSPDTVFLAASEGEYDGVVALYHDQAFIPIKLLSAQRGLTIIAGLSYLRVSPVHGTAFDIVGQGKADPGNLIHALLEVARWRSAPAGELAAR